MWTLTRNSSKKVRLLQTRSFLLFVCLDKPLLRIHQVRYFNQEGINLVSPCKLCFLHRWTSMHCSLVSICLPFSVVVLIYFVIQPDPHWNATLASFRTNQVSKGIRWRCRFLCHISSKNPRLYIAIIETINFMFSNFVGIRLPFCTHKSWRRLIDLKFS